LNPSKQQAIEIKPAVKMVAAGATNIQGPRQRVLPLSSKCKDNMESNISFGSKLNDRSSWDDSAIGEECLNKLRVQDMKIEHFKKKLVFTESSSFPTKQGTVPTHGNICKDPKTPQCVVTPNRLLHCKNKMQLHLKI
jgi:hypothetical protein